MNKILLILILLFNAIILQSQNDTLYLNLDDCKNLALENNYKIKIANSRKQVSEHLRKSAKTKFFGEFSFTGQYLYTNKAFKLKNQNLFFPVLPFWAIDQETMGLNENIMENPLINGILANPLTGEVMYDSEGNPAFLLYSYLPEDQLVFGTHHNFMFGPGFIQPIYLGGKIKNIYKIAQASESISESQVKLTEDEILFNIEEAYWRVITLQEKEKLAIKYLKMLERLIEDLENIHQEGIITYNDVLKAKVKYNEVELQYIKANNGLALSKMALCQIIGLPLYSEIKLENEISELPILPTIPTNMEEKISSREEIKILEQTEKIALANQKISQSRFLPNIAVSANYLFTNPNPYNGFEKEFGSDWSLGLTVNIPIFHWGDRIHTMRASKSLMEYTNLQLQEAEQMIQLEIMQTWLLFKEAVKKVDLCEKSLMQAEENLRLSRDSFNEGMIPLSDLLEAQAMWQSAFSSLIESKSELKVQEIAYRKTTGQL
ncbi:MAG TPA: TolC family protein [Bacteroidales bacterium]|nr:TolC family protein [Bacteroidales bacterium]HXK80651.1 TolC family protein [Bacteroidales bacterium]